MAVDLRDPKVSAKLPAGGSFHVDKMLRSTLMLLNNSSYVASGDEANASVSVIPHQPVSRVENHLRLSTRAHTVTPRASQALYGCPSWCTEQHDERDVGAEWVHHAAMILWNLGGDFGGLYRIDHHGRPGPVVVNDDRFGEESEARAAGRDCRSAPR